MTDNSILCELPAKYIEWRISNFFELSTEVDDKLESASFSFSNAKWFLRIYTNGETRYKSSGWIGLYLMRNKSIEEHCVTYTIGINNIDGSNLAISKSENTFTKSMEPNGIGRARLIERSDLLSSIQNVAPDRTLTVFCALQILNRSSASPVSVESASQTYDGDIWSLSEDFKNIYINRRCTDVTLIVKSEEFHAHMTVLITRSSVFASMFEHNFSEKSSGKVEIPDCDPSSFEKFLFFLYTGKLDNVSLEAAVNLYKTADKYDVRSIKLECVAIMRRDLCVEFFCDAIHLAMIYRESDLLKDATSFFIDNAEEILSTTKWQQFLEEHSSFCNELLLQLVKSKNLRKDTS